MKLPSSQRINVTKRSYHFKQSFCLQHSHDALKCSLRRQITRFWRRDSFPDAAAAGIHSYSLSEILSLIGSLKASRPPRVVSRPPIDRPPHSTAHQGHRIKTNHSNIVSADRASPGDAEWTGPLAGDC